MTVRGHDTRHGVSARLGLEAPLVERERDLASLAGVLDSAGAGAGRIAWVEGSAGTGKTRLVAEVLELAEARGMSPLAARGAELGFTFRSSEPLSMFRCKLDRGTFRACRSPQRYRRLHRGKHTFKVRGVDPSGNQDPTPAKRRWRVKG